MTEPARLDKLLVATARARSRAQARELIEAGSVTVDGRVIDKPGYVVRLGAAVQLDGPVADWVGRGAVKLVQALLTWGPRGLRVQGRRCLDVGASTGGFSQVLLRHGAAQVTALDVGHDQLSTEVAADPRVTEVSGTNIRDVVPGDLGEPFDLVVADLSFISLVTALPAMTAVTRPGGDLVLLVKPQFEVGRQRLGKGGVVRSPTARAEALSGVVAAATGQGLLVRGLDRSPVRGTHGNAEYLLWLGTEPAGMMSTTPEPARPDPAPSGSPPLGPTAVQALIAELTTEEDQ